MKVKAAAMQAFPFIEPASDDAIKAYHPGLSLRDYIAIQAMQGVIASTTLSEVVDVVICSQWSYKMADAMLEARK